jgi:hypothetical protein
MSGLSSKGDDGVRRTKKFDKFSGSKRGWKCAPLNATRDKMAL